MMQEELISMLNQNYTKLVEFNIPLPKGKGKFKNQVASLNSVARWHWKSVADIKSDYKHLIKDWYINTSEEPLSSMSIVFEINRHNNRILDSDNLGFIIKWTIDAIKESGWLVDDDQITYLVLPSKLNIDLIETSIKVTCYKD